MEKNNWINTYLRKIGEAPVILDSKLTTKSINQIYSYCENNGYFNAKVSSKTKYKNKKAYEKYLGSFDGLVSLRYEELINKIIKINKNMKFEITHSTLLKLFIVVVFNVPV